LSPASRAWVVLAGLLCACAVAVALAGVAPTAIDWQPSRAVAEPWRALTAIALHYSALHLGANLAGAALVAALGAAAAVSKPMVWAWAVATPLTQFGLLARPDLLHYGGLSGVLHAGAGVVAVHLLRVGPTSRRIVGLLLAIGLVAKVIGEAPWGAPLRAPTGWDITTAPLAHATGLLSGVLCAAIASAWPTRSPTAARDV